ncbi:hypothetical protein N8198_01800 [Gammaproteobacteria bacterium]|nr:hypothetical protein [Gammaproteobacteria bacterium]
MVRIAILLLVFSGSLHAGNLKIETLNESQSAFNLGGSRIIVEIRDRVLRSKKDLLLEWAIYSAETVSQYYGRFPVDKLHINVQVTGGHAVRFGQAFGGESPLVRVVVGEHVTSEVLRRDWIMVHEMVHLAMADVPEVNRWWLEGLSTYVESIARAQRGHLTEEFVWNGFYNRMPQGLPKSGDRGLDQTPTWGRTYWGGAMFCLLADIEIRKLTNNRKSLQDALRGVLDDGYSMQASANPMQIFESADRAVGVSVLEPLYQQMKAAPFPVDLDKLWQELGIRVEGDAIVYDNDAPLAHIRKTLLKP